ncbi:hypothetical protein FRX31_014636 [Thalictrum thalictroides]|uniref:Uncharacterized protein n=1 Tax=Thalictrum thalictroides TaxID=46969 RepID=A0A7J6WEA9_THATH|nr:hypothetical protein FRX31_014636 [Thalictrum thalictroides]
MYHKAPTDRRRDYVPSSKPGARLPHIRVRMLHTPTSKICIPGSMSNSTNHTNMLCSMFASTINARTAPEEYWKQVMKDQPMPDALQGLVNSNPSQSVSKDMVKTDCHTSLNTKDNKHLANDVLTDPNLIALEPLFKTT